MRLDVNNYLWKALDTIFPPRCSGCEKWGVRLCNCCFQTISIIKGPICNRCGEPVVGFDEDLCADCINSNLYIDYIRSWAVFEGVLKGSIHKLKYCRDIGLGKILSVPMVSYLEELDWGIDLIIPVPLDNKRMKSRGYNQASLLANPISGELGIQLDIKSLTRIRYTESQVGLSINERIENVKGAFQSDSMDISGKRILLIDDVVTTGSTLNSCSAALKEAGAKMVYGLSLARSLRV